MKTELEVFREALKRIRPMTRADMKEREVNGIIVIDYDCMEFFFNPKTGELLDSDNRAY